MKPIEFVLITNPDTIKEVYSHDGLYNQVTSSDSPITFEDWVPETIQTMWALIVVDTIIAGIVQIKPVNRRLAELHIGLKKQYRRELGLVIGKEGLVWLRQNTTFKHFMTFSPITCKNVILFLERIGFTFSGVIHDGINYQNEVQNLLIYEAK